MYDNNQNLYIDSKGNSCGHGHPMIPRYMHVAACGGEDAVSIVLVLSYPSMTV